jgi:hypothetical protein
LCVRWYLRYSLSYRDLEEMMAERNLGVDHSTIARWVLRYVRELNKRIRRAFGIQTALGVWMRLTFESRGAGLTCIARCGCRQALPFDGLWRVLPRSDRG